MWASASHVTRHEAPGDHEKQPRSAVGPDGLCFRQAPRRRSRNNRMETTEVAGGWSHSCLLSLDFRMLFFSTFLRYRVISGTKVTPNFHFLGEGGQRLSDTIVSGSLQDYEGKMLSQGRHAYNSASEDKP